MTPDNIYRRRDRDECRACNREDRARRRSAIRKSTPGHPCGCGCGTLVSVDSNGRRQTYVNGHQRTGKSNTWKIVTDPAPRTSHQRAVKLKQDIIGCEWTWIGGCLGPLHVAHVDGDEMNNAETNLLKLCQAHHFLLDRGRIDPAAPVMPAFYVDRSGKRRYARAG